MGIEIDNEVYAALQMLGQETVVDLARHLVRARCMHPVFAQSAEHAGRVVLAEATELMEEAGVNHARAHAEAMDVVVTGLRFMGREWAESCGREEACVESRTVTVYQEGGRRGSVLGEAARVINGERQDVYGAPERSFERIANYWTEYLGDQMTDRITPQDVAMMMTLFKIAREANQHKRDNIIDAAGYLGIYADMQEEADYNDLA